MFWLKIKKIMSNLFTDKTCHVCGESLLPTTQANNANNAFFDLDTQQYVHFKCQDQHYKEKAKKGMAGLYSEMPVIF